jgi:hypothetical protein
MNLSRVYYLERSPFTGQLQSAIEAGTASYYRTGELYVLSAIRSSLAESYDLLAIIGDQLVYERLWHLGQYVYAVDFTGSNLESFSRPFPPYPPLPLNPCIVPYYFHWGCPLFLAKPAGNYNGYSAWKLAELNPNLLDFLEDQNNYNIVGDTFITIG